MLHVKRFASFKEIKTVWQNVEHERFHYPFQSWWYNNLFAKHFANEDNLFILGVYENHTLLAIGAFEIREKTVTFLGTKDVSQNPAVVQDITDFADLFYAENGKEKAALIWESIFLYFTNEHYTHYDLTYIREDSPTYHVLSAEGATQQVETSPLLQLPKTWEDYLTHLSRKQRHELKRKMHRLSQEANFTFQHVQTTRQTFDEFIVLHKRSDPHKAQFMNSQMEAFFWDLATAEKIDWQTSLYTLSFDDKTVASLMTFTNSTHVLLYNSGYDPAYAHFSVGLLVKAFLVKHAIEEGKTVYDFLRGNERYKYDLGAQDQALFQIHANT